MELTASEEDYMIESGMERMREKKEEDEGYWIISLWYFEKRGIKNGLYKICCFIYEIKKS
jgi:hypothetical protein